MFQVNFACALAVCGLLTACGPKETAEYQPGEVRVTATLSTNDVRIGDPVDLDIAVHHPPDGYVILPDIDRGKEINIRDQRLEKGTTGDDHATTSFDIQLSSWMVGDHVLATNAVVFIGEDGRRVETAFPDLTLRVVSSVSEGEAEFRGLAGLAFWGKEAFDWVTWALIAVALVAVIVLAVVFTRGKKTVFAKPPPPPTPAHEIALKALKDLLSKGWIEQGQVEPFYVRLSDIVRGYLENRFQLHAPEQTTEEFIRETSQSSVLSYGQRTVVCGFLEQADLVKFAKHAPGQPDMRNAFSSAEELVEETKEAKVSNEVAQPSTMNHQP